MPRDARNHATGPSLEPISLPAIQQQILVVREPHVMLDEDLAKLLDVETPTADRAGQAEKDRSRRISH